MRQLTLSIFNHGGHGGSAQFIQPALNAFERKHNIHVELEVLNWHTGWSRLVEIAIYGSGPDLSEVGSTWVMDLVRMNALRAFSPAEMKLIGSENDFMHANWLAGITADSENQRPTVWGIPWSADTRVVFYHRDYLEQAKIDPAHAFEHVEELGQTVAALKASNIKLPVSLSTLRSNMNIHQMASWVWDCGGDFMMPDGKHVAFNGPKALRGMHHYFGLGPFIPPSHHRVSDTELDQLFYSKDSAMLLGGAWVIGDPALSTIKANLGVALMPGGAFVGGSHLVTWKHSHKNEEVLLLLDFLIKNSVEQNVFPTFGLPAYQPDWAGAPFIEEPYFSAFRSALQTGRSFPTSALWGLVEKRLADIIPAIWQTVLNSEKPDVDKILSETIMPLAKMLNLSLES